MCDVPRAEAKVVEGLAASQKHREVLPLGAARWRARQRWHLVLGLRLLLLRLRLLADASGRS